MPIDAKLVPPHPTPPGSNCHVPSSPDAKTRIAVGLMAAGVFKGIAKEVRDSIGHPLTAIRESAPYEDMAEAWAAWAAGEESWVAFCGRNRRIVNRIRRDLGLKPIPVKPRKKGSGASNRRASKKVKQ